MLWERLVTKLGFQSHQNSYKMACAVKDPCRIQYVGISPSRCMSNQPPKVTGAHTLIMIRHGQSEWNKKNIFCGWFNSDLSERGRKEAEKAGNILKESGYKFDIAFTSVLKRANNTLVTILKILGQENIPVVKTWRLNERHYGNLTGLDKVSVVERYGLNQVAIWRRGYETPPPPITPQNPFYNKILNDKIYRDGPSEKNFPKGESLKQVMQRVVPFWKEAIAPEIKKGKSVLISGHISSLRSLIKHLDEISDAGIMDVNLPTGIPFKYILDENLKPVPKGSLQYMDDPEIVKKAIQEVVDQITDKKKK